MLYATEDVKEQAHKLLDKIFSIADQFQAIYQLQKINYTLLSSGRLIYNGKAEQRNMYRSIVIQM